MMKLALINNFYKYSLLFQVHIGIKGRVTDTKEQPIPDAIVKVTGPAINHDITTGISSSRSSATLEN